jgi:hypothetical protein
MRMVQSRWAQGRRNVILGALVTAGLTVAPVHALLAQAPAPAPGPPAGQTPPPAQPAAPTQPAPGLLFDADAGLVIMNIKSDKTADFEKVMSKLHDALAKSDKPERRQQAAGWKLYRAAEPGPGGAVTYVHVMTPTLKGADYTVTKIMYEVFPTEVQALFPLLRDSFASGTGKLNLTIVQDFGAPATGSPSSPPPNQ